MPGFSAQNFKNTRQTGLDLLRGLAVLLVICRHWNLCPFLTNLGWIGVDLFFVLSGFLISGLLFSEHEKTGKIDFSRFFTRRGLKIYPLFFLLIAFTFITDLLCTPGTSLRPYLYELFFVQNYLGGVYVHTWSLAVEEHFYLILFFCFAVFIKKTKNNILFTCLFFMLVPLLIRLWNCVQEEPTHHFFLTHTRIDSLFTGVLLNYLWRYKKEKFGFLSSKMRYILLFFCLACLSIFGLNKPENNFTQGVGFTLIAFSFAGIILYTVSSKQTNFILTRSISLIGFYSYAIYLIHIPALEVLELFGIRETHGMLNIGYFSLYLLICIGGGLFFSEIAEQPLLRLRDKFFPSKA